MASSVVLRVDKGDAHAPRPPEESIDPHHGRIRDLGALGAASDHGTSARAAGADRAGVYDGKAGHRRRDGRAGDPPDTALVLCVDEKTPIQALDRSQPVLPLRPGQPERRTHDDTRPGTTTLFAAFNTKTGNVITAFHQRQRARELRKFLTTIDGRVPAPLDVHLIVDNSSTHKTPAIHRWLARHPRFHVHFTPTGASWINLVERWFAALTEKQLRRGVHRSTRELESAIRRYVELTNAHPSRSSGPRPPMRSSRASRGFVSESLTQDTSRAPRCLLRLRAAAPVRPPEARTASVARAPPARARAVAAEAVVGGRQPVPGPAPPASRARARRGAAYRCCATGRPCDRRRP